MSYVNEMRFANAEEADKTYRRTMGHYLRTGSDMGKYIRRNGRVVTGSGKALEDLIFNADKIGARYKIKKRKKKG
ncbi:hypothetical protein ACFL0V_01990 [Nanoarchaeota archaeon]